MPPVANPVVELSWSSNRVSSLVLLASDEHRRVLSPPLIAARRPSRACRELVVHITKGFFARASRFPHSSSRHMLHSPVQFLSFVSLGMIRRWHVPSFRKHTQSGQVRERDSVSCRYTACLGCITVVFSKVVNTVHMVQVISASHARLFCIFFIRW